jgi:hypothetical protein
LATRHSKKSLDCDLQRFNLLFWLDYFGEVLRDRAPKRGYWSRKNALCWFHKEIRHLVTQKEEAF